MADPVVKFGKILVFSILIAGSLAKTGNVKLPETVKCVDEQCKGSQGYILAQQNYPHNDPSKLNFNLDDKLVILGKTDGYRLARNERTGQVGLLSDKFVNKFEEDQQANFTVELSSVTQPPSETPGPDPSPTSDKSCVINGTPFASDVCKIQNTSYMPPGATSTPADKKAPFKGKEDYGSSPPREPPTAVPTPGITEPPLHIEQPAGGGGGNDGSDGGSSSSISGNILQKELDCGAECSPGTGADAHSQTTGTKPTPVDSSSDASPALKGSGPAADETPNEANPPSSNDLQDGGDTNQVIGNVTGEAASDNANTELEDKPSAASDSSENPENSLQNTNEATRNTSETDTSTGESADSGGSVPNEARPSPGTESDRGLDGRSSSPNTPIAPASTATPDQPISETHNGSTSAKTADESIHQTSSPQEASTLPDGQGSASSSEAVGAESLRDKASELVDPEEVEATKKTNAEPLATEEDQSKSDQVLPSETAPASSGDLVTEAAQTGAIQAGPNSSPEGSTQSQETPKLEPVKELPSPKVIFGQTSVNPTKVDNSHRFRPTTRRSHSHGGHSHGGHGHSHDGHGHSHDGHGHSHDGHGHSHDGHGHSHDGHGHSHDGHGHSHDGHGHSHDGPVHPDVKHTKSALLAEDSFEGHSYPGEKPDSVPAPTENTASKVATPGATADEAPDKPTAVETDPIGGQGLAANAVAEDKPAPVSANEENRQGPAGEPPQYTVNTLEQTCERKDGVGCDGEPVVAPEKEDAAHPPEEDVSGEQKSAANARKSRRDDTADSAIGEYVGLVLSVIPEPLHSLLWDLEARGVSSHVVVLTFLCGLVGAFLLIFFSCISMNSKEGALSDYIARLEQQLFALKKEREILLESKDTGHSLSVVGATGGDQALPSEVIEQHERELEVAHARASDAEQEVRQLQEQLERAQAERDAYSDDYNEKLQDYEKELTELRIDVETSRAEVEKKDNELRDKQDTLSALQANNAELLEEAKIWDQRVNELTSRTEANSTAMTNLQQELEEKCAEVEALKESLKNMGVLEKAQEASGDDDEEDIMKRLVDVQKAQKQCEELISMNATLRSDFDEMKEQCNRWRAEIDLLKESLQVAERDKQDSVQKLTVLTEYFKDKELKLQRDVVMHETLRQQKESDALSVSEHLDLYREQTANLQAQVASMKEEIEVSERRYKRQLMEQEKKTHENWMAYKNAVKTIEDLNAETQVLRQQIIAAEAAQRAATQGAILPQDRPRPPPPLPLPKGAQIAIPPLPLPNGLKASEMPSPPMARYIDGVRRTPPVGVVPLPTVLYQAKSGSSRHSSERKEVADHRRREVDREEGRSERKSKGDKVASESHRDHGRDRDRERAERRRERKSQQQQITADKEKALSARSADTTNDHHQQQQQQQSPGANEVASEVDREPSSSVAVTGRSGGGANGAGGGSVKENGGSANGRSIHSGGSKGGIMSPELRRAPANRRSDRGYDRGDRGRVDREHRPERDRGERSPRDQPRR